MGTSFSKQTEDDWPVTALRKAVASWHQRLKEAEVTFTILMAANETDAPLKSGGYKVLANIRIIPLDMRAAGLTDVLIKIDQREWDELSNESQYALLDHELSHIDLAKYSNKVGDGGEIVLEKFDRDDVGRPKLKTIPGNWNGGDGFIDVIKRHGRDAVEFLNATRVAALAIACEQEAERGVPA